MRLQEARRDLYRRLAKEQGYKSRAAFKLIQAAEKYRFLEEGMRVADFGAAPGGWLQVAAKAVGPAGRVAGVDLREIHVKEKNVKTFAMDIADPKVPAAVLGALGGQADVVLSDLAPSVSGVWELDQVRQADLTVAVLAVSRTVLKPRGDAFLKLFEGEGSREIRDRLRVGFGVVRAMKPAASRSVSSELYYYCSGWDPEAGGAPAESPPAVVDAGQDEQG